MQLSVECLKCIITMEEAMKKRYSEEQIHEVSKESELGVSTPEVCRKYGIGGNTFYRWSSKYG
nr:transposase [Leptospira santarosai]